MSIILSTIQLFIFAITEKDEDYGTVDSMNPYTYYEIACIVIATFVLLFLSKPTSSNSWLKFITMIDWFNIYIEYIITFNKKYQIILIQNK